jgi:AcrR family transcriptional regulator/DNA-binding MarR family transcriptional regulator
MSSRNGSRAGPVDEGVREGAHVVEMQRRRLLGAIVDLVHERGARGLTVATICARASLSRRTFYELYEDREACLLGAFEYEIEQATRIVEQAIASRALAQGTNGTQRTLGWRERIRVGLTALLSFFDGDPGAARLLVVEALSAGEQTLHARQHTVAQLIAVIDEGREEAKQGREPPPLTAEGVVGAVSGVIHARILDRDERPLTELTGALMAIVVQPYLGAAAAQRELERPVELEQHPVGVQRLHADPFKDLPMRLTYRTVRVLCSIADMPGASNKQVARAAGIEDEGQTSKLLKRLHEYGLIDDSGAGPAKGMPRAWSLTERGEGVLQAVGEG